MAKFKYLNYEVSFKVSVGDRMPRFTATKLIIASKLPVTFDCIHLYSCVAIRMMDVEKNSFRTKRMRLRFGDSRLFLIEPHRLGHEPVNNHTTTYLALTFVTLKW